MNEAFRGIVRLSAVIALFLGAATWVTVISLVGYLFGSEWHQLVRILRRFNLGMLALVVVVALILWVRHRIVSADVEPR